MQFGFFLLVAAAVLLVGSDIVSASIDADTRLSKTSSNILTSADAVSVHGKVGRFLRTSLVSADVAWESMRGRKEIRKVILIQLKV
ncbi:hypothetical protein PF005_g20049 [Phytophthora fragariae]|uniref:RxLR effector protein n=1 Tax=Phytophthora fragariae TaxID=53985 RepID=A0A6A3XTE5_9STRA|nr:hypothetical protein PF003_g6454 [Phytophthora fragariae]KAE8928514.1 hypothetical protein PF009_g21345 [Phytophthora fragariae]KAE8993908.1 hypothetical protein PF011_g16945 [Phytophthora fragariae]KAE9087992.1 hypothetical protein PF007_g20150 [Phytophthora fragariae]KAE9113161.1 hypothetical protein PF006_g19812 [Phytophthora fragariae]